MLKGDHAFYLSREDIEQRFSQGESHFKAMYRFLSSQAHSFPMSFYRTVEQKRGTGVESETEKQYISMTIEHIILYLQLSAQQMIGLFPDVRQTLKADNKKLLDEPFINYQNQHIH